MWKLAYNQGFLLLSRQCISSWDKAPIMSDTVGIILLNEK
jgi:hypothetical protein